MKLVARGSPKVLSDMVWDFVQKRGLIGKGCPKDAQVAKQKRNKLRECQNIKREQKSIEIMFKNPNRKEVNQFNFKTPTGKDVMSEDFKFKNSKEKRN